VTTGCANAACVSRGSEWACKCGWNPRAARCGKVELLQRGIDVQGFTSGVNVGQEGEKHDGIDALPIVRNPRYFSANAPFVECVWKVDWYDNNYQKLTNHGALVGRYQIYGNCDMKTNEKS